MTFSRCSAPIGAEAQGRVFIVLMVEHQYGDHGSGVILISSQCLPPIVTLAHSSQEAPSPVVAVCHAIFVFQQ
jgi:hypothetical protein